MTSDKSRQFFRAFLRNKSAVGALNPSGRYLAEAMVDWFDWEDIRSVVEVGPGTGVFTRMILTKHRDDATFVSVERDADLALITKECCPDAIVVNECCSRIAEVCGAHNLSEVDAILSGLPWAVFPDSLQMELLAALKSVLKPGGQFATFAYLQGMVLPAAKRFRKLLQDEFSEVKTSPVVWRNLPPAFVYRCVR
jgi:phospholipid N-methyltransferase